jgi:adenosylhomocysteine nucleosidase
MNVLVVMALDVESQGLFEAASVPVLFTGVGKINAAFALTRRLTEYRLAGESLPVVANFGTAGSHTLPTGSLVACRSFVQRDMDVTALGFNKGVTPFDRAPATIEFPVTLPSLPQYTCSSADSFETRAETVLGDVLDMEAYALAKVCWMENVSFVCAKYITDGADASAADDWRARMPGAAAEFLRLYRTLTQS